MPYRCRLSEELVFILLLLGGLAVVAATPAEAQSPPRVSVQDQFWNAAMTGDTVVLRAALGAGAVIDSLDTRQTPNGRRALHWAASFDRGNAIRFLVRNGAKVNATNRTGFTPLHHAAEKGSLDAARVLIEAGANRNLVNTSGDTPAELARQKGHHDIAKIIESGIKQ